MNRKVMRMLYGGGMNNMYGGNVTDIRSARRNSHGQYMGYDQMPMDKQIGFGAQDRYNYGANYNRMTYEGENPYGGDPYHQQPHNSMVMGHTQAGQMVEMGSASIEDYLDKPLTVSEAMQWAEGLEGGPHFKKEELKPFASDMKPNGPEFAEFYAWANALYCDYHDILKKYGMDRPEVYADLAKATMNDSDAVENKGAIYYRFIVDGE